MSMVASVICKNDNSILSGIVKEPSKLVFPDAKVNDTVWPVLRTIEIVEASAIGPVHEITTLIVSPRPTAPFDTLLDENTVGVEANPT
jgi:hypothetical protein